MDRPSRERIYTNRRRACRQRGFPAERVLFVGNDMLNDVAAAAAVGLRTALFAGDQRSLRLREKDPRPGGDAGFDRDRIDTNSRGNLRAEGLNIGLRMKACPSFPPFLRGGHVPPFLKGEKPSPLS